MKWHYQFTPHDVFDCDATEPPVLVDVQWQGQPRKLLIQANRNGFFYVLDRTNGKILLGKPFVKQITWAKEIGPDGRPKLLPLEAMGNGGTKGCPAQSGGTNWFSTAFDPATSLYYVQTLESCGIYTKAPLEWAAGKGYMAGSQRSAPDVKPQKVLRAIDIRTGNIAWELPQSGPGNSWGGVLGSVTGLVFFDDDSGMFRAVDAANGNPLWQFQTNEVWKASPMTYMVNGKQYLAVAAGASILTFGLPD